MPRLHAYSCRNLHLGAEETLLCAQILLQKFATWGSRSAQKVYFSRKKANLPELRALCKIPLAHKRTGIYAETCSQGVGSALYNSPKSNQARPPSTVRQRSQAHGRGDISAETCTVMPRSEQEALFYRQKNAQARTPGPVQKDLHPTFEQIYSQKLALRGQGSAY